MTLEMKKLVYSAMEQVGSLEFTKKYLVEKHLEILNQVQFLEQQTGTRNYILRLLLDRLRVDEG